MSLLLLTQHKKIQSAEYSTVVAEAFITKHWPRMGSVLRGGRGTIHQSLLMVFGLKVYNKLQVNFH